MSGQNLETISGTLDKTVPQMDILTIRHSDELTAERLTAEWETRRPLRDKWYRTGDMAVYYEKDGKAFLGLARVRANLIFQNLDKAVPEIRETGNYRLDRNNLETVIKSEGYAEFDLSELNLQGMDAEWRYFEIRTGNYDSLNPEQRKLAERVYGKGQAFIDAMQMLKGSNINATRIYVLNPEYVKKYAPKEGGLGRVCLLLDFSHYSEFGADGRFKGILNYSLRGVRAKKLDYESAAGIINDPKFDPISLAARLNHEGILHLRATDRAYSERNKMEIHNTGGAGV